MSSLTRTKLLCSPNAMHEKCSQQSVAKWGKYVSDAAWIVCSSWLGCLNEGNWHPQHSISFQRHILADVITSARICDMFCRSATCCPEGASGGWTINTSVIGNMDNAAFCCGVLAGPSLKHLRSYRPDLLFIPHGLPHGLCAHNVRCGTVMYCAPKIAS